MEERNKIPDLLEIISRPGFYVNNDHITAVNSAAASLAILCGTPVQELIRLGLEEYRALEEGCLCLTLCLAGRDHDAYVARRPEGDLFLLEQDTQQEDFRALALAAKELRAPLSNALEQMERLLSVLPEESVTTGASMNRSLYQMLRTLSNMSDSAQIAPSFRPEIRNIAAVMDEIFDKAQYLAEQAGIRLLYTPLQELVLGMVDAAQLERAVYNILSNAMKFTPRGGTINASLTRRGQTLRLTVADSGEGISRDVLQNLFFRYLRQPSIEDNRFGLGLGLVLVRKVAANHGGTVLLDQSTAGGARVTLTLPIRQDCGCTLCSPLRRPDYAGERDHGLVELADVLPASLYNDRF